MSNVRRYGRQVEIGEFMGEIADAASKNFSIAWGGISRKGSLDDKHYRLITGEEVCLAGSTPNRILRARVANNGTFFVETITPANNSLLLAFNSAGVQLFKKGSKAPIIHIGLTDDAECLLWISKGQVSIFNIEQQKTKHITPPNIFNPSDVRYVPWEPTVLVKYGNFDWYRFSITGVFIDEDKWRIQAEHVRIEMNKQMLLKSGGLNAPGHDTPISSMG